MPALAAQSPEGIQACGFWNWIGLRQNPENQIRNICFFLFIKVNFSSNGKSNNLLEPVSVCWQSPGLLDLNDLELSLFNSQPCSWALPPHYHHDTQGLALAFLSCTLAPLPGSLHSKPVGVCLLFRVWSRACWSLWHVSWTWSLNKIPPENSIPTCLLEIKHLSRNKHILPPDSSYTSTDNHYTSLQLTLKPSGLAGPQLPALAAQRTLVSIIFWESDREGQRHLRKA